MLLGAELKMLLVIGQLLSVGRAKAMAFSFAWCCILAFGSSYKSFLHSGQAAKFTKCCRFFMQSLPTLSRFFSDIM